MNGNKETFYKRLSKIGMVLHSDPLSVLTRKNQLRLLATAMLAILFASESIDLKKITLGGAEFIPKPELVVILLTVVCGYFLIIFLLGVISDMRRNSLLRTTAAKDGQDLLIEINLESQKKFLDRQRIIDEIFAERSRRLEATHKLAPDYAGDIYSTEHESKFEEWHKQMEENNEYFKKDGLDDLTKEQLEDQSELKSLHRSWSILSITKSAQKLNRFRIAIDIVFPILLGSAAIILTLLMHAIH